MTKLVLISDTHEYHERITIPKCDILCHTGDFSNRGKPHKVRGFLEWFSKQPANHAIYISGNHDCSYEKKPEFKQQMIEEFPELIYLEDSGVEVEGLKIYGSPYTPEFCGWNFMHPRGSKELADKWDLIPRDTDVLLTHGMPYGILDKNDEGEHCGCELLRHRIEELPNLKLVAGGHIHEGYQLDERTLPPTVFVNASIWDHRTGKLREAVEIEL